MKTVTDHLGVPFVPKQDRVGILYSLALVLMYFGYNYSIEYATDTYPTFQEIETWKEKIFINGRLVAGFVYYIFEELGISGGIIYHISQLGSIVFLTCSVTLLSHIYNRYIRRPELSVLLSFITLVNPFIIEYFLFVEKGLLMFAVFLNVLAFYFTEKMWRRGFSLSLSAATLVLLLMGVFTYQTSIQVFVVLALPIVVIDKKDFIKKNIYLAFMYVVCMGSAYALMKWIFASERLQDSEEAAKPTFFDGLEAIRHVTFDSFFHMSRGVFFIWWVLLMVVSGLCILAAAKKFEVALSILYIMAGCVFVSFVLQFIVAEVGCSPRTIYSYGMIFGVTLFYAFFAAKAEGRENIKAAEILAFCIIATIFLYDYLSFGKVIVHRYKCNQEDLYYAGIIGEQIEEYEQHTGETVDTICFYADGNITWFGEGYNEENLSTRAQSDGWSRLTSINLYLEKEYKEGESVPKYREYFSNRNWNTYSQEQLIFDGRTLHLCVY